MKLIPYSLAVVVSLALAVSASADWALYSKRGAAWVLLQQFPTFEQCMGTGKPYADTNGGKISCLRVRWYGLVGITATNVDGGTKYLRHLLDQYSGDAVKALAAYNAGPQRVEQYGGVPPYPETRAYVMRIIDDYNRKKLQQQAGSTAQSTGK